MQNLVLFYNLTPGKHPHRQDITYMNRGQHSSITYRTFQISQMILKPRGFLSVRVEGRAVGTSCPDGALCWDRGAGGSGPQPKEPPAPSGASTVHRPCSAGCHGGSDDPSSVRGLARGWGCPQRGGPEPNLKL